MAQLALFNNHTQGVSIQQVADGLDLGQDQPPFGRFLVNRHHQHRRLARTDQIGDNGRAAKKIGGRLFDDPLLQHPDSFSVDGGGVHQGDFFDGQLCNQGLRGAGLIGLVHHH